MRPRPAGAALKTAGRVWPNPCTEPRVWIARSWSWTPTRRPCGPWPLAHRLGRSGVWFPERIPLDRPRTALVAVLLGEPSVQRNEIDRSARVLPEPGNDRLVQRRRLVRLPSPSIHRLRCLPSQVVAHRALRHAERPGDRARARSPLGQRLDRHPCLQVELPGHPGIPTEGITGRPIQAARLVTLRVALARS
jgi:hypothetical protein